jgi:hypothetical protein
MNDPAPFKEQVLRLAAQGRITPEEGEQLLKAQGGARGRFLKALWDPYETLPPRALLALAGLALAACVLLARVGCRFDGAIDFHPGHVFSGWKAVAMDLAAIPLLATGLIWALARVVARGTRFRDLLVNLFVARIPLLLIAPVLIYAMPQAPPMRPEDISPQLILAGLCSLPFIVWNIALIVLGIRNASGLHKHRLALVATLGILGAEIASKLLLYFAH